MYSRPLLLISLILSVSCNSRSNDTISADNQVQKPVDAGQVTAGPIDLASITSMPFKGRVQDRDYSNIPAVDQLIAQGPSCIPFLIDHLDDETRLDPEVVELWNSVAVADVALMILTDLFTDSSWQGTTVPEAQWYAMLEYSRGSGKSAEQALREFVRKHGRKAIKEKWSKIWNENRDKIFWDESERCFNIKN